MKVALRPPRLSIRARLVIAYALILGVVLGGTFGLLQWRLHVGVHAMLDEDLLGDAKAMAGFIDRGDVDGFRTAEAIMRAARGATLEEDLILLRDWTGTVVGGYVPSEPAFHAAAARRQPGVPLFANVRFAGVTGRFREVTLPRTTPAGDLYYVQILRSLEPTDRMLDQFGGGFVFAAVLASAAAAAGGLLLSRVAFRPFTALVADARAMSPEDLDRRLRVPETGDELARLTEVLNELLDRVAQGVASVRRFVHDASHEVRTPLASLRLGSEALLRDGALPESARDLIVGNLLEIERLSRLVDDLLALARAEGEPARRPPEPVDVAELVDFVAERVRPLAEAGDVALTAERRPCGAVAGDRDALVRVLWNLCENAVKYTPAGGRVRVECAANRGTIEIRVEDTGAGIAAEDLPRVFERFYRGGRARGGGTGLGLAIARALARRHGGDVTIASEPGKGTAATVTLPEAKQAADAPRAGG